MRARVQFETGVARDEKNLQISDDELARAFADPDTARRFPPILNIDQACELAQVPKGTLYDWSSRGLLRGCSRRVGKRLRIFRDRFIKQLFNHGIG